MGRELWGTSRDVALIAILSGWLPACGGKSENTAAPFVVHGDSTLLFASGARLKAHYLDAGGGARKLLGFHDTLLDTECNFVETAAGQYACLPVQSTRSFSDARCSAPILPVPGMGGCARAPAQAGDLISAPSLDCGAFVGAYSLDAQQTEDQSFSLASYGGCNLFSPAVSPLAAWTTKPEPLTRFEHGTPSIIGAPDGAQATRVTGDDGAFATLELVASGTPCRALPFAGADRCVPEPIAGVFLAASTYADCSDQNVAVASPTPAQECLGIQPQYMIAATSDACSAAYSVSALGDTVTSLFGGQDSCAPISLGGYPGEAFYRRGASAPSGAFPVVHPVAIGTGALTINCFADSTGTPILEQNSASQLGSWALPDGTLCGLIADPSGQERCLPEKLSMDAPSYFADATCTRAIYLQIPSSCDLHRPTYLAGFGSCGASFTQVYRGSPYLGPVYTTQSGTCLSSDPATANSYLTYVTPGDPLDPAIFPAVNEATDP